MSPTAPGIDKEFKEFLQTLKFWNPKRLDNIAAPLLKRALIDLSTLKGRVDAAAMTNLEQQIGSVKGKMRKLKQTKCHIPHEWGKPPRTRENISPQ